MSSLKPHVAHLVWDAWNRPHIARHGVTPAEVEEAVAGEPFVEETYKGRLKLIGPTLGGRMLAVIIGPVPDVPGDYYVFTARPAHRTERRAYAAWKGGAAS